MAPAGVPPETRVPGHVPWGSVLASVVMGASAIGAVIVIVSDRSDEAASAVMLVIFLVGLIVSAARIHRRRMP